MYLPSILRTFMLTVITLAIVSAGKELDKQSIIAEANSLMKEASTVTGRERLELLKKAARMVPDKLEPLYNLGIAAKEVGDVDIALGAFGEIGRKINRKTNKGAKIYQEVTMQYASLILQHPTYSGDSNHLNSIISTLSPFENDDDVQLLLIKSYFKLGNYASTSVLISKLIEIKDPEINFIKSYLSSDVTQLSSLVETANFSPSQLTDFGFSLLAIDEDLAIKYFSSAILISSEAGSFSGAAGYQVVQGSNNNTLVDLVVTKLMKQSVWNHHQQRVSYLVDVDSQPFPDSETESLISIIPILLSSAEVIIEEWDAAVASQRLKLKSEAEHQRLSTGWGEFSYVVGGVKSDSSGEFELLFPKTANILSNVELLPKGFIGFSSLQPQTSIASHCGATNHKLRLHLGVTVPSVCQPQSVEPLCAIKVGNETRGWLPGGVLTLDDSFLHSVWNNGTETRVVLIIDVWHPNLSKQQRKQITADFGYSS